MRKLAILLPLLASACAVGPDYVRTQASPLAQAGFQTQVAGTVATEPAGDWWRLYNDPALDRMVAQALAANTDLRAARANLLRAQAAAREVGSYRFPTGELSGGVDYGNDGGSQGRQGSGSAQWSANGGITANWEVDLFGRISRSIEAADADAQAQEAVRDTVALTVAAETARAYTDACSLGEAAEVARESARIAEREYGIQQDRVRVGAGSKLDAERSATSLANVRAELPSLEGRRRAALFELAALMGLTPSEVPDEARSCTRAPAPVAAIPVGDGRGLLARRPDVREAERRLAADTARVGVATADLYPSISLGGSGNFFRNDSVKGSDSFSFSAGPLISWSWPALFVGRSHVEQAEAGAQASLANFDGAVLTALKEAEQALSYYAAEGERNLRLNEAERHAETAYMLAQGRHRAGSISFLELIDAQRQLLEARMALANSNQLLGSRRVDLFKALGGGWQGAASAGAGE